MYYEHKQTGQIVKILTVDDRQDLASAVINDKHTTVVWSEFLKKHQPLLGGVKK